MANSVHLLECRVSTCRLRDTGQVTICSLENTSWGWNGWRSKWEWLLTLTWWVWLCVVHSQQYDWLYSAANLEPISGTSRAATAGREWLATWRLSRKMSQGQPVPLPLPVNYNYYANITELLHKSHQYPILHR